MNGAQILQVVVVAQVADLGWRIAAVADVNGVGTRTWCGITRQQVWLLYG
jgi:hypothetical protein